MNQASFASDVCPIEFRGKTRADKQWICGDLRHWPDGTVAIIPSSCGVRMAIGTPVDPLSVGRFTGMYDATRWEDLSEREQDLWDLSRKGSEEWLGRKIFEHDFIETQPATNQARTSNVKSKQHVGMVVFQTKSVLDHGPRRFVSSGYEVDFGNRGQLGDFAYFNYSAFCGCRVIGNRMDNPELLFQLYATTK